MKTLLIIPSILFALSSTAQAQQPASVADALDRLDQMTDSPVLVTRLVNLFVGTFGFNSLDSIDINGYDFALDDTNDQDEPQAP